MRIVGFPVAPGLGAAVLAVGCWVGDGLKFRAGAEGAAADAVAAGEGVAGDNATAVPTVAVVMNALPAMVPGTRIEVISRIAGRECQPRKRSNAASP